MLGLGRHATRNSLPPKPSRPTLHVGLQRYPTGNSGRLPLPSASPAGTATRAGKALPNAAGPCPSSPSFRPHQPARGLSGPPSGTLSKAPCPPPIGSGGGAPPPRQASAALASLADAAELVVAPPCGRHHFGGSRLGATQGAGSSPAQLQNSGDFAPDRSPTGFAGVRLQSFELCRSRYARELPFLFYVQKAAHEIRIHLCG